MHLFFSLMVPKRKFWVDVTEVQEKSDILILGKISDENLRKTVILGPKHVDTCRQGMQVHLKKQLA